MSWRIKSGKNSTGLSFLTSVGFFLVLFFFFLRGGLLFWHKHNSDQTSPAPALPLGLGRISLTHSFTHSMHPSTRLPGKHVNYIPLQCHSFRCAPPALRHNTKLTKKDDKKANTKSLLYAFHYSLQVCSFVASSCLHFHKSFTMWRKSRWRWAFFGWLSPSTVLSAGSGGMSPFPSARISAAAPSRSRTASRSAGCPWCGL